MILADFEMGWHSSSNNVSLQENLKYSYAYYSRTDKVVMTDGLQTL